MEIHESKKFNYTFMREIIIKRQDEKKYKFLEADFPDLYLNDIEDMYLEKVQGKIRQFPTEHNTTSFHHYFSTSDNKSFKKEWKIFSLALKVINRRSI